MGKREDNEAYELATAQLRAGTIGAGEYLRRTREKWRLTSRDLYEHWRRKLPTWVEPADIEQELAVLALEHVSKWRPGMSDGTIGQYVYWNARHRGQRTIHRWRGASLSGNEGKNPSRAELAFCRAFGPDVDPMARAAPTPPSQDGDLERAEAFAAALAGCECIREAVVLLALRKTDGSPAGAARAIYEDFAARIECGVGSEAQARRVVGESVRAIAARAQAEAASVVALLPPEDLFDDGEPLPALRSSAAAEARLEQWISEGDGVTTVDRAESAA
jgi:hypothetical protein